MLVKFLTMVCTETNFGGWNCAIFLNTRKAEPKNGKEYLQSRVRSVVAKV